MYEILLYAFSKYNENPLISYYLLDSLIYFNMCFDKMPAL